MAHISTFPIEALTQQRQSSWLVPIGRAVHAERERAERLMTTEIEFIANPSFHLPAAETEILGDATDGQSLDATAVRGSYSRDLPPHLARLCEVDPLAAHEERQLFRRLNYLKFRANALRSSIDPARPLAEVLDRIEGYLQWATATRDQILRANMRLVFSIAKKLVTRESPFEELLSDGIMILVKAIDKFDYDRGFRFSTYAYRSIVRNANRSFQNQQKRRRRRQDVGGDLSQFPGECTPGGLDERNWDPLQAGVARLMKQLDRREQFIVGARFSLGVHQRRHALQELAHRLGISKERVRQLEQRALGKLRKLAVEWRLEELLEPALGRAPHSRST